MRLLLLLQAIGVRPAAAIALLCVSIPLGEAQTANRADLVLYNGKIVTVQDNFEIVQAVAVKGDRIAALGSDSEVRELASPETRSIDLRGKTVLPGLMDSHVHSTGASMYEFDHMVPEMETIEDVLAYVQSRADVLDDGDWIRVRQVFITRLRDQRYPTRDELDRVAPKNPVFFSTARTLPSTHWR